jgi:hypothetical protein
VVIPLFFTKLMLTHIVCWKYKAETTPEMRADHRAKLMALPKIIRNSVSFNPHFSRPVRNAHGVPIPRPRDRR